MNPKWEDLTSSQRHYWGVEYAAGLRLGWPVAYAALSARYAVTHIGLADRELSYQVALNAYRRSEGR